MQTARLVPTSPSHLNLALIYRAAEALSSLNTRALNPALPCAQELQGLCNSMATLSASFPKVRIYVQLIPVRLMRAGAGSRELRTAQFASPLDACAACRVCACSWSTMTPAAPRLRPSCASPSFSTPVSAGGAGGGAQMLGSTSMPMVTTPLRLRLPPSAPLVALVVTSCGSSSEALTYSRGASTFDLVLGEVRSPRSSQVDPRQFPRPGSPFSPISFSSCSPSSSPATRSPAAPSWTRLGPSPWC